MRRNSPLISDKAKKHHSSNLCSQRGVVTPAELMFILGARVLTNIHPLMTTDFWPDSAGGERRENIEGLKLLYEKIKVDVDYAGFDSLGYTRVCYYPLCGFLLQILWHLWACEDNFSFGSRLNGSLWQTLRAHLQPDSRCIRNCSQ